VSAGDSLHGHPTAAELVDAVREFLDDVVGPAVDPSLRFHVRVAANVLAVVGREMDLGPGQEAEHDSRLAALGLVDDAELARVIRDGAVAAEAAAAVRAAVEADVRARLLVANPRYLEETP